MRRDPIVEAVRRTRRKIEAECGNDPDRLYARLKQIEEKYRDRLVTMPPKPVIRPPRAE